MAAVQIASENGDKRTLTPDIKSKDVRDDIAECSAYDLTVSTASNNSRMDCALTGNTRP